MPPYASSSGFAYRDGSAGLVAGISCWFPVPTASNPLDAPPDTVAAVGESGVLGHRSPGRRRAAEEDDGGERADHEHERARENHVVEAAREGALGGLHQLRTTGDGAESRRAHSGA